MYIFGCVHFYNKREKMKAWRELKQEFGDKIRIIIREDHLTYSAKVDRNFL
jgi:hypothetical protein